MTTKARVRPSPPAAAALRQARLGRKLTLAAVVARVREEGTPCSTSTLWGWERGLPIPERAWMPLARALRCSLASLREAPPA